MKKYLIEPRYNLIIYEDIQPEVWTSTPRYSHKPLTMHHSGQNKYLAVSMSNRLVYLHHLVIYYSIGPRPEGLQINHIDGNRYNNLPNNLEYCTPQENIQHAYNTGLNHSGKNHKNYTNGLATRFPALANKIYRESNREYLLAQQALRRKLQKEHGDDWRQFL